MIKKKKKLFRRKKKERAGVWVGAKERVDTIERENGALERNEGPKRA